MTPSLAEAAGDRSRKSGASCSEIAENSMVQQLGSLASVEFEENSAIKHMENIVKVKNVLMQVDDPLESMLTVDYLQKLGIDYHFEEEIESMLCSLYENVYSNENEQHTDDLFEVALCFRLLRQAGYPISSDVFNKFTDDKGKFKATLRTDIKGPLSLYEASYLNKGENILNQANEFSKKLLTSCIENLERDAARIVRHALKHPCHMTISRYNVCHYLEQTEYRINGSLEDLARLDFNQVQLVQRKELNEVLSWWKSTGLAEELKFARNQPLKWYMWPMTMLREPQLSGCRIEMTKIISFVYLIDDIFDIYGSPDELKIFTDAISEWELSTVEALPNYMQTCYTILYNTTNEIAQTVLTKQGLNPINSLRKSWSTLCNAFLLESTWLRSKQIPKANDYLRNAIISSGVYTVLMHTFFLLEQGITKENVDFLESNPALLSSPATILRLWDDLGSAKDENQEGLDGSYVECYMKENPQCSAREARDHVKQLIHNAWQNLNEDYFSQRHFAKNFVDACLNSARMIEVMYRYDDSQDLPIVKDYVDVLLFKSM